MALKPDRSYEANEVLSWFGGAVMERGGIVSPTPITATGVGAAMDSATQTCIYHTATNVQLTGQIPLGILLTDVVNIDQSRQHLNQYKAEVQLGDKVLIATKGEFVTNMLVPGAASTGVMKPCTAYLGPSGLIADASNTPVGNTSGLVPIGKMLTNRDPDGYARVRIDL